MQSALGAGRLGRDALKITCRELAAQLQKEGAESFVKSWEEMMDVVAKKAQSYK